MNATLDHVYLTLAYCPSAFSGEGAVVKVAPDTGAFSITRKFDLPDSSLGCPMLESVTHLSDPQYRPQRRLGVRGRTVHWSWTSQWGRLTLIDLDSGRVAHRAKGTSATGDIFDGFTSFAVGGADGKTNVGLSPHVTAYGFCSDGCMRLGHQDVMSGVFTGLLPLPFKAAQSDVSYYDADRGVYYQQGSYPLTPEAHCDTDATAQCLFAVRVAARQSPDPRMTTPYLLQLPLK